MLATSKVDGFENQNLSVWRSPDAGEVILDDYCDCSSNWTPQVLTTSKVHGFEGQNLSVWISPDVILDDFRDFKAIVRKPTSGRQGLARGS